MFGALPDHIIKDPKVTVTEKCVLLVLALHADRRDSCYPSQRTIAEMLGSCRKTVNRALNSLARKGLITITDRFRKGDAKGQTSSLYTLNFKRFDDMSHGGGDVSHGGGEMSYPLGREVPRVVVSCPTGGGVVSHQEQSQEQTTNRVSEQLTLAPATPGTAPKKAKTNPTVVKIVQAYTAICVPARMPKVRTNAEGMPSPSITKMVLKAARANGADYDWSAYFTQASRGSHLRGENDRKWRATLSWLCNPTNAAKVESGNYGDSEPPPPKGSRNRMPINNFPR